MSICTLTPGDRFFDIGYIIIFSGCGLLFITETPPPPPPHIMERNCLAILRYACYWMPVVCHKGKVHEEEERTMRWWWISLFYCSVYVCNILLIHLCALLYTQGAAMCVCSASLNLTCFDNFWFDPLTNFQSLDLIFYLLICLKMRLFSIGSII